MEPSSIGIGHIATSFGAAINKKVDNAKNAISNFTFTSKGSTKKQISQTEKKDDSPQINKIISKKEEPKSIEKMFISFDSEISQLNSSINKATGNVEIKECLRSFGSNIVRNCITGKPDKDTLIAAERYVNTILDVLTNKPEAADICMQHFANQMLNINVASALLNNPRFQVSSLDPAQAKIILKKGRDIVEEYRDVSPSMLNNMCELTKLIKPNKQDSEKMIEKSLAVSSFDLAESLIEINEGKIPNKELLMDRAVQERNIDLAALVIKYEGGAAVQELIKKCIDGNLENFLNDILIVTGQTLSNEQISQFSIQAHNQGNLTLMKAMSPDWKELASSEFKSIPEDSKQDKLTQYFLNSNIKETGELTSFLNEIGLVSDDQLNASIKFNANAGRLIARFPSPSDQQEMHREYGQKYSNYEQQQIGYGVTRLEVVNQTIGEIKDNPSKSLESIYLKLNGDKPWRLGITSTPLLSRYAMFKNLAINKLNQSIEGASPNVTKNISKNSVNISFTPLEGEPYKLTTLAPMMGFGEEAALSFRHSAPIFEKSDKAQVNPRWLDQLGISKDWDMLVNMKVDAKNPESIKEFITKVSEFYWKGIQLMPTERGNSQNMLELHYILYKLHDIDPPAASRNAILPDCVALCSTLEEFMKLYNSCWDR